MHVIYTPLNLVVFCGIYVYMYIDTSVKFASVVILYFVFVLAYNPKSNEYIRKKYKKKLIHFEEKCDLISYLSSTMRQGYQEPALRPIDFKHKMSNFLGLKECCQTNF